MELIPSMWQLCMYRVEHFHPILMNNLVNLLVCYCPCLVNMLLLVIFYFRINEPVMFKALIEQFNLIQRVNISTHVAGNTWLGINPWRRVSDFHPYWLLCESDHCAVIFNISCVSIGAVRKSITYWKWKSLDVPSVQSDISKAFHQLSPPDLSSAVEFYNDTRGVLLTNTPLRNHGRWLSERINLGLRRNSLNTNDCGGSVTGHINKQDRNLIKYHWMSKGIHTTTFWIPSRKISFRIKIANAQSSKYLYGICDNLLNLGKR